MGEHLWLWSHVTSLWLSIRTGSSILFGLLSESLLLRGVLSKGVEVDFPDTFVTTVATTFMRLGHFWRLERVQLRFRRTAAHAATEDEHIGTRGERECQ